MCRVGYDRPPRKSNVEYLKRYRAANRERINAAQRARYANDPEYQKRYRIKNRERVKAQNQAWRVKNPEREARNARHSGLRKYGLTQDSYDALLMAQNGLCAICGVDSPGHKRTVFCVDHDHATNEVRGLLCFNCNVALGHFRDNPEILSKAIIYLKVQ